MKRAIAAALLLLGACAAPAAQAPGPRTAAPAGASGEIAVTATPVPLNPEDPRQVRVGELVYAGGVALRGPEADARFGEISGIDLRPRGGGEVIGVTDTGGFLQGRLVLDGRGRLTGLAGVRWAPLLDEAGAPLTERPDRDAEGVVAFPGDDFAVSFERRHRVWAYDGPGAAAGRFPWSGAVPTDLPENEGFEALAHAPASMPTTLVLGAETGRVARCALQACTAGPEAKIEAEFALTGLDGVEGSEGAFAVFRAYDEVRGSRAIIAWTPDLLRGAPYRPLARLEAPLTVDNFEGITAERRGRGWRLYLISDDNGSPKQRTLLLAFDWTPQ